MKYVFEPLIFYSRKSYNSHTDVGADLFIVKSLMVMLRMKSYSCIKSVVTDFADKFIDTQNRYE